MCQIVAKFIYYLVKYMDLFISQMASRQALEIILKLLLFSIISLETLSGQMHYVVICNFCIE